VAYRRWIFNVLVVFLLSGFWHGANWTFIVWGALHSLYYFIESEGKRSHIGGALAGLVPPRLMKLGSALLTFVAVLAGWVFFRAASVGDATYILGRILSDWRGGLYSGPSEFATVLGVGLIGVLMAIEVMQEKGYAARYDGPSRLPALLRWPGYVALLIGIGMLGLSTDSFIYFQF
jgi:hypothetical protein